MAIPLIQLGCDVSDFPEPRLALADPDGLLAYGGDLSPERVLHAYQQGIFPWFSPQDPILWWSPSQRAVFICSQFKPSKSLRKFQRRVGYRVTINHAFDRVIDQCADTRSADETWITSEMKAAYKSLHRLGHAHSIEVWQESHLVGGLYGINLGQLFCGESMFSIADNASKIALWYFSEHFVAHQGQILDAQIINPHLSALGAVEVGRDDFLQVCEVLQHQPLKAGCFSVQEILL